MKSGSLLATRRQILKGGGAAGVSLVIGFHWASHAEASAAPVALGSFAPNAFIRISPDGTVTVISKHTEFGQGVYNGLATIVAEELDADWARMRVESAPVDEKLYANLLMANVQHTGGSMSIANSWTQLRTAGATARAMLVAAAAKTWRVPAAEITVDRGVISHTGSERSAGFGAFTAAAAQFIAPPKITLKDPREFKLIGRTLPRIDGAAMTDGSLRYAIDLQLPGMRVALVLRSPRFGGVVRSFDSTVARRFPGVIDVVQIPTGVAVVANSFWAAKRGRDALEVTWDDSKAELRSSAEIFAAYGALAQTVGKSALDKPRGNAEAALAAAAKRVSATYLLPYVAHAPMESLNAVCRLTHDSCEIWSGTRNQTTDHKVAAEITGLARDQVRLHTLHAGGSFGRRGPADATYKAEAVAIAKALGADGVPLKVVWVREDDIQSGPYRPMVHHSLNAGLDASGKLIAWHHRIVGQGMLKQGAADLPYDVANFAVETHEPTSPVPTSPLRSVDHTHTAFAVEAFLDDVAFAAGKDPVALRRELLAGQPRYLGVLDLATRKAGWGEKLPPGKGRGVALHFTMRSYAAHVVDISVGSTGDIRVDRIVCAVDCGLVVNPGIVRGQIEGGILFGLSVAMYEAITLKNGLVEQANFNDYRVLRMFEVPKMEIYIVPSTEAPTGVGELGVPPVAPALVNAIFSVTGKRVRTLPLKGNAVGA